MYTVTCSACGQAEKSPFARVGAVMVCGSCKAKVPLRAEDVKRQFKLRLEIEDDLFRVPQVQRMEEAPPPAPEPEPVAAAASQEIHEDHAELAAEAERRAEAARKRKGKGQAITKAGMSSGELAQHLAKKRHMQTALIVAGVAAAAIIVAIVIISAASNGKVNGDGTKDLVAKDGSTDGTKKDGTSTDGSAKDGSVAPPVKDGDKDKTTTKDGAVPPPVKDKDGKDGKDKGLAPPPAIVRVSAMPLGIDQWQTANEAYLASPVDGSVMLVDESSEKQENGGQVFKANIVCQAGVASALVSVTLVNDEDRVYAKFERPFYLLEGRKPRPLTLVIPKELVGGATSVYWAVQPIDTHVTNASLLEDTLAEVIKADAPLVLRISAYNPSDRKLKDGAFVIQAMNPDGQINSQWRLKYPHEVGAKSWVKFEAELTPTELKNVASWRVLGAGIPSGEAVAPPPPPDVTPKTPEERDPMPKPRTGRGLFDF